jgi:Isopropylmalate/homocitrate/citramalate synthases
VDKFNLLDCTLRDGAYLVDKHFGVNSINGIISGLLDAKVDWIEVGFLQDEGSGDGNTVFLNSIEAQQYIPESKGKSQFSVLADYGRYSIKNLDKYTGESFDAIRACFFKHERKDVIDFCKGIKEKGYKLFIQPVDTLGYTDFELLDLISDINEIQPYCFSIVDTFGSMYLDDLQRIFHLIHANLDKDILLGFHSHNNLQMSSALSQEFLRLNSNKREVVVDATISGMGRGAGNTPLELVMQYMNAKLGASYNLDAVLDLIDGYMNNIQESCSWGYDTSNFMAGCFSAHVNNVSYLKSKTSIRSKDIRYILNKVGGEVRKRYHYDLLEETYLEYIDSKVDDSKAISQLKELLSNKNVVVIAPGKNAVIEKERINEYIAKHHAIVISVNYCPDQVLVDYIYFNNIKRYEAWNSRQNGNNLFSNSKKIVTSNIIQKDTGDTYIVNFRRLIKCGWERLDNSIIILLRLLDILNVNSIGIAGFDGYNKGHNYAEKEMELISSVISANEINSEIVEMLTDYKKTRTNNIPINFVTTSKFEKVFIHGD